VFRSSSQLVAFCVFFCVERGRESCVGVVVKLFPSDIIIQLTAAETVCILVLTAL